MKQLRNILTPLVLLCLLAAGFPVFAQEQEEAAPKMQDEMTSTNGILRRGVKRTLLYHYLSLFIVLLQVGIRSFLPVSLRMEALMKGSPSPPKEVSTKANWWSIMQQESRFVRGIFPLRR